MDFIAVINVDAGVVTKYEGFATLAEAQAHVAAYIGAYPNAFSAANPGGGPRDWVADVALETLTLSDNPRILEKKNALKASVGTQYSQVCAACSHLTYTWQADQISVGAIIAKHHVLEASPPATVTWVDATNIERTMAWADFTSLRDRLFDFHESAFSNKHAHRTAIDALSDLASANAYDIMTGWPV